jgi:shikimate dehydrogenase
MHASAQAVGAVNVIKILRDHDGEVIGLEGHNTDARAFGMTIEPMLTPQRRSALVMGTGGAAKAVATALAALNVEVSFVSRRKNASTIAYEEITRAMVASHGIIVNATPVGMYPHVEQCPDFPCRLLTPHHLCYDLIYNQGETTFLKQARQAGAETKNGLEMLLLQAFLSYEVWTGNGGTSAAQ